MITNVAPCDLIFYDQVADTLRKQYAKYKDTIAKEFKAIVCHMIRDQEPFREAVLRASENPHVFFLHVGYDPVYRAGIIIGNWVHYQGTILYVCIEKALLHDLRKSISLRCGCCFKRESREHLLAIKSRVVVYTERHFQTYKRNMFAQAALSTKETASRYFQNYEGPLHLYKRLRNETTTCTSFVSIGSLTSNNVLIIDNYVRK